MLFIKVKHLQLLKVCQIMNKAYGSVCNGFYTNIFNMTAVYEDNTYFRYKVCYIFFFFFN